MTKQRIARTDEESRRKVQEARAKVAAGYDKWPVIIDTTVDNMLAEGIPST